MEKILKSVLSVLMVGMGLLACGADDAIPLKDMWDTNRLYTAEMVDSKISQAVEGVDYNNLTNKPSIGGVTLEGNKTASALGLQPTIADYTTTGAVQNIVEGYGYATETAVVGALNGKQDKLPYPTNAIPQSAVSGLGTALAGKADDNAVVKLTGDQSIGGAKTFTEAAYFNMGLAAPSTLAVYGQDSSARFEVDDSMTGDYVHFGVGDFGVGIGFEYTKNGSSYRVDLPERSGVLSVKADVDAAATAATNYTDTATAAALSAANAYTDAAIADLPPPAETDPRFREWVGGVTNQYGIIAGAESAMFAYTLGGPAEEVSYSAGDITAAFDDLREAIGAAIANTNPTFSNAVLSVGLGIDTNTVAVINALVEAGEELPIGGAATVGGLLLALAAAVAALKRTKADADDLDRVSSAAAEAKSTADTAKATADNAYSVAKRVETDVNFLSNDVYEARTVADEAKSSAEGASSIASAAVDESRKAWSAASEAKELAQAANTNAEAAKYYTTAAQSVTNDTEVVLSERTFNVLDATAYGDTNTVKVTLPAEPTAESGKVADVLLRVETGATVPTLDFDETANTFIAADDSWATLEASSHNVFSFTSAGLTRTSGGAKRVWVVGRVTAALETGGV